MAKMLVTCPETAHLEEIDYDLDPLGMLIHGCTRYCPRSHLVCGRTCAARFDQRARTDRTARMDPNEPATEH